MAEDGGFEPPRACTQHAFQLRVPVSKGVGLRLFVQVRTGEPTWADAIRRRRTWRNCNRNCNRSGACSPPCTPSELPSDREGPFQADFSWSRRSRIQERTRVDAGRCFASATRCTRACSSALSRTECTLDRNLFGRVGTTPDGNGTSLVCSDCSRSAGGGRPVLDQWSGSSVTPPKLNVRSASLRAMR